MKAAVQQWLAGLRIAHAPDEFEVKQLLQLAGFTVPSGKRLLPGEDLTLPAFAAPWAAKVCSPEVLHKTEQKGVLLDLDEQCLTPAVSALRARFPGAPVLIERQIAYRLAEFIIGAFRDPDFGAAVMVGSGGVLTELYQDVTFRLAPCPPSEALRMLRELTIAPVLSGYRGADMDDMALASRITAVGELALALGDRLQQLDVNPLVYSDQRWVALDAKLLLNDL